MRNIVCNCLMMTAILCCVATHAKPPKKVTLPSGQVLEDPFILGQNPEGLEVGHKNGIVFLKFDQLPKDVQQKYNYDPKKAEEYRKQKAARKKKQQEREQTKRVEEQKHREKYNQILDNAYLDKLGTDIEKCERRIEFLKSEIPKLEGNSKNFLNKTTSLAGTSVSGGGGGSYYTWGGGFYSNNNPAGQRAETTKRKVISGLSNDYTENKSKLKRYQNELNRKQDELISMKKRYEKLKAKQASNKK